MPLVLQPLRRPVARPGRTRRQRLMIARVGRSGKATPGTNYELLITNFETDGTRAQLGSRRVPVLKSEICHLKFVICNLQSVAARTSRFVIRNS